MNSRRRTLIALAGGALAIPLRAYPQRRRIYRIGYLANESDPRRNSPTFQALFAELEKLGYIEGKNLEVHIRWSGGNLDLFPSLATEIVRKNVDVIVTGGSAATRAAKAATDTVPIVFASAADPVGQKLVANLLRPGGNVTGVALAVGDLGPKRLQLLKEMLPRAKRFVRFFQQATIAPVQPGIMSTEDTAARRLNVALQHVPIMDLAGVKAALGAARGRADAIILTGAGLFVGHRREIAQLAVAEHLPMMCADGRFADSGALASYGENFPLRYQRVALLVDKVLRRVPPAGIPVEQSAVFELVVNLQTAKALALSIPEAILLQADRVIQ